MIEVFDGLEVVLADDLFLLFSFLGLPLQRQKFVKCRAIFSNPKFQ